MARQISFFAYPLRSISAYLPTQLILLSGLLLLSAQASAELPLFSAEYKLTRRAIPIATVKLSLTRQNDRYLLESKSEPVAPLSWVREDLVVEKSYWQYHDQFPRPNHYRYIRSNRNSHYEVVVDFNWKNHQLTTTTNGDSWKTRLAEKTVDKALVQLALMRDLAQGRIENSYAVADGGHPKIYHFSKVGEEQVASKIGTLDALKIARSKSGKPSNTTLWLAPKLNFLPIRIDKTRDGTTYSMSIIKLSMPQPATTKRSN